MVKSILDDIPGIGETRRKKLLSTFGSVQAIAKESADSIAEKTGISKKLAHEVLDILTKGDNED
jgi:excinuclease ABC subunit C